MPVNEAEEIFALTLIVVVHVMGLVMLVWGMLGEDAHPWRPRSGRRDDGPADPPPDVPRPPSPRRELPLPGAQPSRVRLRDETPLRDAHPRPSRRPSREPPPERAPR